MGLAGCVTSVQKLSENHCCFPPVVLGLRLVQPTQDDIERLRHLKRHLGLASGSKDEGLQQVPRLYFGFESWADLRDQLQGLGMDVQECSWQVPRKREDLAQLL